MTFLNPLFLLGLAASALPVLFHLFARRKSRRVEFSSLRFLQKLEKTSMRAVKIRQLLLLIVRTLLVIAVVLAFARPALRGYLGSFFGSSHANTSMVFLLDNSASMSRSDERGELLKQSKEAAARVASLLEDGDEATVVPLASIARGMQYNPIHTRREVLAAINDIRIADRPAALPDGLGVASASMARSLNVNKEIYLFSDDQARNLRDGWANDTLKKYAKNDTSNTIKLFDASTKMFTMTVGNGDHLNGRNLALDSLKPITTIFEPGRPIQFEAWVRNTTTEPAQNVALSLFYNDERVAQKTIAAISANATERVQIDGPIRGSGLIAVRAELEQDALPFDNTRFTVLTVPASRRIGIFMQDAANAKFIELALSQTLSQAQSGMPFTSEVKRLEDLRSLGATAGHYDAIMVGLGPQSLADVDRAALGAYLDAGHGAAIFLMPGLDVVAANRDMAALGLPPIARKEGAPNDETHYLSFAYFDFAHPFFEGMFEAVSKSGDALHGIESPKVFESYDFQTTGGPTLIKLSNGFPFLSEIKVGKGDVLLYAAPPTLQFSDFPRKSIFLPLVRRSAAYASAVHSQRDESGQQQFVTTEPFDVALPALAGEQAGATVLVKAPDGSSQRAQVAMMHDGKPSIHLDEAKVAGNYTVYRDAEAREPIAAFAVNIQSDESDLRAATPAEMTNFLASRMTGKKPVIMRIKPGDPQIAKAIEQSRYGVELWQAFLWAALILAIIEMIIAREARSTTVLKPVAAAAIFFAIIVNVHVASSQSIQRTNESILLAHPKVTRVSIIPSATDSEIKTFNTPHWLYINRDIIVNHKEGLSQDRHQLLLFIPGTHLAGAPRGKGPYAFCAVAADVGYHVIVLSYPDETAAAVCRNDSDPNAFTAFRSAIIQGGSSPHITIERSESIENRLMKLLPYLQTHRPRENWGQFVNGDGSVKWESVAIAGQSQGGGHAVLIGIRHKVARVIATGAPKDYNHNRDTPASFYSETSATPKDRFFAFNHNQDYVGGTSPEQLMKNLKALGLDSFGPPADVDTEAFPYHHARILVTSFPDVHVRSAQSDGSITAHSSMLNPQNADRWKQEWVYLLTEGVGSDYAPR